MNELARENDWFGRRAARLQQRGIERSRVYFHGQCDMVSVSRLHSVDSGVACLDANPTLASRISCYSDWGIHIIVRINNI